MEYGLRFYMYIYSLWCNAGIWIESFNSLSINVLTAIEEKLE